MVRYTKGNLIDAQVEALVNTVNEVGVMGKGVALMFREAFPESARAYQAAAKAGTVHVGHVFVTERRSLIAPKYIVHFPTKKHWRHPSRIEWIRRGLRDLVRVIRERQIRSVALPPLGCGNGGLDWEVVRREIEAALNAVPDVDVSLYEPAQAYFNAPKGAGVEGLTVPRALVAELIRRYEILGLGCTTLEVQKLAWFVNRWIDACNIENVLGLEFVANRYGPYADQLRHLLNVMDGSYLHCERRLADAGPRELIRFDDGRRVEIASYLETPWATPYRLPLDKTSEVIDGFESPLGMELLATVDWLIAKVGCAADVPSVREGIAKWPTSAAAARRKQRLFNDRMIDAAVERLSTRGLAKLLA